MKQVTFSNSNNFYYQDMKTSVKDNVDHFSNKQLYCLPKSNERSNNHDNQMPAMSGIDSTFKNINQARIINDSFGQLSESFQPRKKQSKKSYVKRRSTFISNPLPPLGCPGSNMSNMQSSIVSDMSSHMNMEPLGNAEELIILNPLNRRYDDNYHRLRLVFFLSTFICLLIALFEISAIVLGILYSNRCEMVDIFLIVSGSFHIVIVLLEWAKSWIWIQSNNPVVPDSNADHMQVFLFCILVVLYILSIVWYTVGFAWIPSVTSFHLNSNTSIPRKVVITQGNFTYVHFIPICSEQFYVYAISYQVVVALLLLFRIVMCCMSNFCEVLCRKISTHTPNIPYDTEVNNPLHEFLPPIRSPVFKWGYQDDRQITGLDALYNSGKFSMITPIPIYPSDERKVKDITIENITI